MPKKQNPLGPTFSTRLPRDVHEYLMKRAKKTGIPPAFYGRAWIEKAARAEMKKESAA